MATETVEELIHAAEEPHASGGLPQLDFSNWGSQIFWLIVALVVLYYLMSRVALPRIAAVIEDRADAIADDLDQAADLRRRAEEADVAYNEALANARAEAQRISAEARAEIQAELNTAIAKADAEIAARAAESEKRIAEIREGALEAVETVATDAAQAIVASLLPAAADEASVTSAVKSRLG